jgi:hypothetical protein
MDFDQMKKFILYFIFLFLSIIINAQDVTIQTDYPSTVTTGQQFNVTWTANSGEGKFEAPSFDGFVKIMGPQTSYNSSTIFENGKLTQQTSYSYTYYLQAVKEGKFVIPPAKYSVKRKTYSSEPMNIEVVAKTSTSSESNAKVDSKGSDLFLNLLLNRKEVYIGEHILATAKIYTKVTLSGINDIKYPSFNNFIKSDLQTPPLTSLKEENVNGTVYGTGIVQQFLLYPQVTGEIDIEPVLMSVLVQQKSGQTDPFFGDFFSSYQTVHRVIASQTSKVIVKPLPGIKPDDYSGIVGKLQMKATLDKDSVNANDAVNLKVTISGTGNLKIAAAPKIKLPPGIEVYDPKISDELENTTAGTSGSKTFEYLIIPRHNGNFSIPPITYSYFDPEKGRYEKLTTESFNLLALKNENQAKGITVYGGVAKEDVQYLGKDIRFLKSNAGNLRKSANMILSKNSFYSSFAFATLAFLVILLARRQHIRRNSDEILVKNRKAGKVAGKRLRTAAGCLKNNQLDNFYDEILKALWGYLSDKLNIPVADLNRHNAVAVLKEKSISDDMLINLTSILDTCEYARFAPSASETEAGKIYEETSHFIKTIENLI